MLVGGIGGGGVVTVGALLGVAAHLEGKGCAVLDVTGLAQKNGPVSSHVASSPSPADLHATRIANGGATCSSPATSSSPRAPRSCQARSRRRAQPSSTRTCPTARSPARPDLDLRPEADETPPRRRATRRRALPSATRLATAVIGDAVATNLFLLGYACQLGRVPVSLEALERAIELNGRAAESNKRAFAWGRLAAHDRAAARSRRPRRYCAATRSRSPDARRARGAPRASSSPPTRTRAGRGATASSSSASPPRARASATAATTSRAPRPVTSSS